MRHSKRWVLFLLGVYLAVFAVCAVSPVDRVTWWAENATVWVFVGWVALLYRRGVRFSNVAYALMALFFCCTPSAGTTPSRRCPLGG